MERTTVALAIAVVFAASSVSAQELSGLAGASDAQPARESTYAWQLEYLEGLGEHFAYSLTYLNEGHLEAHHRDGDAILIWGRTGFFDGHLALGAGVGPYYYYDTLQAANDSYNNDHGWGTMVSYTATWYTSERLFYQLRMNWVNTDKRSFDTHSLLFGFGYQLAPPPSTGPLISVPPQREDTTKNEVTVFFGQTILNSFGSEPANACVIEYRRHLSPYVDWTVSYLYEGENDNFGRSGVTTQFWLGRSFFSDRLSLGFGAGGYATLEYRNAQAHNDSDTFLSGIVTMTTSYRFLPQWSIRVSWNRIATNYNADADGILVGIGYHF